MTGSLTMTHQEYIESFTVEKYILGELSAEENDSFEEHYFECSECAEAVRRLSALQVGVRSGMCVQVESAQTQESRSNWIQGLWNWWLRPQPAFAMAIAGFGLAAVLGFQNWQMRDQLRPQALQAVMLAPETRGEPPVIHPQAAGPFVLLEADLPSASGHLTWTVRSADQKAEFEGSGPAPAAGSSFKLLVPAAKIGAGEHILTVGSNGREWQFRFRAGLQ